MQGVTVGKTPLNPLALFLLASRARTANVLAKFDRYPTLKLFSDAGVSERRWPLESDKKGCQLK